MRRPAGNAEPAWLLAIAAIALVVSGAQPNEAQLALGPAHDREIAALGARIV